jgi:thiosulfate dehydrogenase [quinone] large subunit
MANVPPKSLSTYQQVMLVVLRTLIGWHFLYEGYFKLIVPGWAVDGTRLGPFGSLGYLNGATGPLGHLLHALFNAGYGRVIDATVIAALCAIGLSMMLGALTQTGCSLAVGLLSLFYLTAIPLDGVPHPGMEGNYMLVNKNLIELAAVLVLLCFNTGRIAGFDLLYVTWRERRKITPRSEVL